MPKPNVLYVHSHDTGRHVRPYGRAVETPAVSRLAEEGVVFRQAFSAAPTCSPSRAALLTGLSPHAAGMTGLAHRGGFALRDYSTHLAAHMRRSGFETALAGIEHEGVLRAMKAPEGAATLYEHVLAAKRGETEAVSAAACDFLARPHERPFFLSVGFGATHRPFPEATESEARHVLVPAGLPDSPETRRDVAGLEARVRELDRGVGRVLEALDASGREADTLVVCTTDHGIAFPGMKCCLSDAGLGVMLVVRGPGGFEGGRVMDGMVSHLDICPTLMELMELDPPHELEGRSLLPLVRGGAGGLQVHDELFGEVTYHAAYEPLRSVRTSQWKFIRRFDGRDRPVLPNCDDSPSKDVWLRAGWPARLTAAEQLYDLASDPHEAANLAGDAGHAGALNDMRARLLRWMERTRDPILECEGVAGAVASGAPVRAVVPAPDGAVVNDPDGLSPSEGTRPAG